MMSTGPSFTCALPADLLGDLIKLTLTPRHERDPGTFGGSIWAIPSSIPEDAPVTDATIPLWVPMPFRS
jgi:hypothetical protein